MQPCGFESWLNTKATHEGGKDYENQTDALPEVGCAALVGAKTLVGRYDVIQQGDEYLEDDAETWTEIPALWWGRKYDPVIMNPLRRSAPTIQNQTPPPKA